MVRTPGLSVRPMTDSGVLKNGITSAYLTPTLRGSARSVQPSWKKSPILSAKSVKPANQSAQTDHKFS